MPQQIPKGDFDETDTEMGSLYVDHANERLVRFVNRENPKHDKYEVTIYTLDDEGDMVTTGEEWTYSNPNNEGTETWQFVHDDATAYLSGHNLVSMGHFGVFCGPAPTCDDCGKTMEIGMPERHPPENGLESIGYICPDYSYDHPEFMRQSECIDRGLYLTIEQYLTKAFGE